MKIRALIVETPIIFIILLLFLSMVLINFQKYTKDLQGEGIVINVTSENLNGVDDESILSQEIDESILVINSSEEVITLITAMQSGDSEAQAKLEEMLEEDDGLYEDGDIPIALASEYIKHGDLDLAVDTLDEIPDDENLIGRKNIRLALISSLRGDNKEAIELYQEALEYQPNSFLANYNLGTLCLKMKKYNSSIIYLESAKTLTGGEKKARALANLGIAYSGIKNYSMSEEAYLESINLNPGSITTRLNLGKLYGDMDNQDKREAVYNEVLKLDDKNITALLKLGELSGDPKYIKKALEVNPGESRSLVALGLYYQSIEDKENSFTYFNRIVTGKDDSMIARFNLGKIAFSQREFKDAESHYLRAIELSKDTHFESMNNLALVYKEMGEYPLAIKYYNMAFDTDNEYYTALYNLGLLYLEMEEFLMAQNAFKKSLNINNSNPNAWYNLGITQTRLEEESLAIESYKRVIILDPENIKARINLGNIYKKKGQSDLAINQYKLVTTLEPGNESAWYNLGVIYKDTGDYVAAESAYIKALDINSENLNVMKNLGALYSRTNDFEKGERFLKEAIIIDPSDTSLHFNLALIYKKSGNINESINHLDMLLKLDKTVSKAWLLLGNIYYDSKDYSKAITCYKEVVNLESDNYRNYYDLGKALYQNGEYEESLTNLNRALEGIKDDPWIHYTLGRCYQRLNRTEEAEKAFSVTIKLSPDMEKNIVNRAMEEDDSVQLIKDLLKDNPDSTTLLKSLISALNQNKEYEEALEYIKSFIKKSPHDQEVLTIQADIYNSLDEYSKALDSYISAYRQNPETFKKPVTMGNLLIKEGRESEAVTLLSPLESIKPRVNEVLGDIHYNKKEYTDAIKHYTLLDNYKVTGNNRMNLGKSYYRNKEYDKALESFTEAEKIIDDKVWINTWIARTHNKLNNTQKAIEAFNGVISLNPDFVQSYIGLGDIYRKQDDISRAKAYYEKALDIDPLNSSVKKKLKGLE